MPSFMADEEWALISPRMPKHGRRGRPPEVINAADDRLM